MSIAKKDFDRWNELKKKLHESIPKHAIREGDIWWCSIGLNLGREQDGKNDLFERSVLVLVKFNEEMALVVPLTSVIKHTAYHFPLDIGLAILSQVRLASVKRFQRYIKTVSDYDLEKVKRHFVSDVVIRR